MVDAEGGASILTDSPWYIFDDFITSEYSNALINRYAPDFHRITKRWSGSEISRSRSKLIPTFSGPFLEERQSTQQIWNDSMFIVDIDIIDWAASRRVDFYSSGSKLESGWSVKHDLSDLIITEVIDTSASSISCCYGRAISSQRRSLACS